MSIYYLQNSKEISLGLWRLRRCIHHLIFRREADQLKTHHFYFYFWGLVFRESARNISKLKLIAEGRIATLQHCDI